MNKDKKISIIIPAYNEEKRIGKTLENYLEFFHDIEIYVTMDGCRDRTLDIVKTFAERGNKNNNLISYIHHEERLGKGMGIYNAISHTKGDILVITDADESTSPSEISKLIKQLDDCDCVIGSRWIDGANILKKQPIQRRIASRGFNLIVRTMFGLHFKDTQCGAKVFRKRAVKDVINDISTFNYAFDIDILWHMQKNGFKIKEVPIIWHDEDGSSVKLFHTIITMFFEIIRLRIVNSSFGHKMSHVHKYIKRKRRRKKV